MIEYPKMLYRERNLPNDDLGGVRLDTRIVQSSDEEKIAVREGWIINYGDAIARVQKADNRAAWWKRKREWYEEWKWLLTAIGAVLALAAAIVKLLRP
jgi:hypothetical protein